MLNLTDVLGWGYADIEALEEYIEIAKKFDIFPDDIIEDIKSYEGDVTDISTWFYSSITLIFYEIIDELEKSTDDSDLLEKIQKLRDNFDPYINYMDSWFNNCLDDIDFNQDREKILEDVIEKLREDD
jgi:hypothetical protein